MTTFCSTIAAELVTRDDHRVPAPDAAQQYRNLAEEVELLGWITKSPRGELERDASLLTL